MEEDIENYSPTVMFRGTLYSELTTFLFLEPFNFFHNKLSFPFNKL